MLSENIIFEVKFIDITSKWYIKFLQVELIWICTSPLRESCKTGLGPLNIKKNQYNYNGYLISLLNF